MADISLQSATEIAITDTTLIPAQPTGGVWSKITGLGIKTYLQSLFDAKVSTTGNETVAGIKTFSSSPIVPTPTTGTQASNKDYSDALNPDFYQYSIVPTVASGNLKVALKNYEGNDPTPTKPVKIMIGGVVRTITSALSIEIPGGIVPFFNSGSTELAGKEIDYFTTVIYDDGTSSVRLGITRAMLGNIFSDWIAPSVNQVSERVMYDSLFNNSGGNISATSQVVNIGRFNATLSAGYTWSIPATSVIVNRPIYETRTLSGGSQTGWTANNLLFYYTINGDRVDFSFDANGTSNSTSSYITLPFSAKTFMAHDFALGLTYDNGVDLTTPGRADLYGQYINLYKDSAYGSWTASGAKIIRGQGHYYI